MFLIMEYFIILIANYNLNKINKNHNLKKFSCVQNNIKINNIF